MVKYIPLNRAYHRAYVMDDVTRIIWYGPVRTIRRQALEDLKGWKAENTLPMYWTAQVAHILDKPSYFPNTCFRMEI